MRIYTEVQEVRSVRWICVVVALAGCNDTGITITNRAPIVTIEAPVDGHSLIQGGELSLRGSATDSGVEPGRLRIRWASSVDGVLLEGVPDGEGSTGHAFVPTAGEHQITLRATDPEGLTTTAAVTVTVLADAAPSCSIATPTDGALLPPGSTLLQGLASDDVTPSGSLAVAWTSSLDGPLDATPPASDGAVTAFAELGSGDHVLTLTVTDARGQACTDSVAVTVDGAPSAPAVALDPAAPTVRGDLRALLTQAAVDPEGGDIVYTWAWSVDGAARPDLTDAIVPLAELVRGQAWTVSVIGTDPAGLDSPTATASATVVNAAPDAPTVVVTPVGPTAEEDLLCAVTGDAVDPDGDTPHYTYAWLRDGVDAAIIDETVPFAETAAAETWMCVVTPDDGALDGPPAQASVGIVESCTAWQGAGADRVVVPDAPALRLAGDFTLELWALAPQDCVIVSKRAVGAGNGWALGVSGGHPWFQVGIDGDPRITAADALDDPWTHLAVTHDADTGSTTLWVDGQPSATGTLPTPSSTATADLLIGGDGPTTTGFGGTLDDLRISDAVRYALAFVPASALPPDGATVASWRFEAPAQPTVRDWSGHGHDGVLAGGTFSTDSVCDVDLAPTPPTVAVGPAWPLVGDDLTCTLTTPGVDPEGALVSYAGQWLRDGQPSGIAIGALPAVLPASATALGERWTCRVSASDGLRASDPAEAATWVGAEPVCTLEVGQPDTASSRVCGHEAAVPGVLRFRMVNPDASRDGTFVVDAGVLGRTWLFTGYRTWAYGGTTAVGFPTFEVAWPLLPADGPASLQLAYDPGAGVDQTGPDSLIVDFVYAETISTAGATALLTHTVASADASNGSFPAASGQHGFSADERLLVEVTACGSAGVGGHGLYLDDNGVGNDDGFIKTLTGDPTTCNRPLKAYRMPAGTFSLYLAHEDDFWTDNSGDRIVRLWRE